MDYRHSSVIAAAVAVAASLAAPAALAQDDVPAPSAKLLLKHEEVIVTAPRSYLEQGEHGGQVREVTASGKVEFDDLDLSTPWGRSELKARIRVMASNLCGNLERQYPVSVRGGQSCYEQAVNNGMHLADRVLADSGYDYWKE
jgi:UrcA family protein